MVAKGNRSRRGLPIRPSWLFEDIPLRFLSRRPVFFKLSLLGVSILPVLISGAVQGHAVQGQEPASTEQQSPDGESSWAPVPNSMMTQWGESVRPDSVWSEYPRPQLVRENWTNLNGLWDYAVTPIHAEAPADWDGKLLVPFAIESPLSGVGRRIKADEALWYRRSIEAGKTTGRTLLHFEAVDYECEVWVGDRLVGGHRGGNLPFTIDITDAVSRGASDLTLKVVDATDAEGKYQLRGKQKVDNKGIFYTPVTGIWQTVWMEQVPENSIADARILGDASGKVVIDASLRGSAASLSATLSLAGQRVITSKAAGSRIELQVPDPQLWSPGSPTLYDLQIDLLDEAGQVVDSVKSYVGLRTVGKRRDAQGDLRLTLNGKQVFHWGPLDQGWWPDGLLTPPADEAMLFEIDFLKRAGFNMIRKHIKVEPRRYYYHCDRIGMLVWQDQVSGGAGFESDEWPVWKRLDKNHDKANTPKSWKEGDSLDATWPDHAHEQFMAELKGMVDHLYNYPSIVCWVPFNERWGQHRTMEVGRWIVDYDPSRLVNIASGGNFFPIGDMADEHVYPHPNFPTEDPRYDDYVKIVGEFGGHGWPVKGHLWQDSERRWGYGGLPATKEEYIQRYEESIRRLAELKKKGVAGAVYTQTTDVEGEINGLMTYDRRVIKISAPRLNRIQKAAGLTGKPTRLSSTRPNIIVVLVDDMGFSDLGCYGSEIETPHIDALAAGGLRFTQFYNQGRCCPTRASLMTGLQPHQAGIGHMTAPPGQPLGISGAYQGYLNDQCTTLAEVLKASGYHTLMTGKWHLGIEDKSCWPLQRGFDRYYGGLSGAFNYFKPGGDRGFTEGNEPVETGDDFYVTDALTDRAIEYIEEETKRDDQPFFLYLSYNAPHWPVTPKWEDYLKYKDTYQDGWRAMMSRRQAKQRELGLFAEDLQPAPHPGPSWESLTPQQRKNQAALMAAYAGVVDNIDQNIGKLTEYLKQAGKLDETLIFFLSDNGACQEGGRFGSGNEAMIKNPPLESTAGPRIGLQWAIACNTPFRKFKHYVHEGGACTPMIAHWPAGIAHKDLGTLVRQPAYLQDFMATVLELSGGTYPESIPVSQGRSLGPLLAGLRQPIHDEPLFWEHEGNAAVRQGKWKLVREYEQPWELYDMESDRTELNDLADQMPVRRNNMIRMWENWAQANEVSFPKRFNMYEHLKSLKSRSTPGVK